MNSSRQVFAGDRLNSTVLSFKGIINMTENLQKIHEIIVNSNLILSKELHENISNHYQLERFINKTIKIDNSFIKTYEIKLESIKNENTEYSFLLSKTTEEMIQILKNNIGIMFSSYKVCLENKKIYYWFGIDLEKSNILFIHKLVKPRELTLEEKTMVDQGNYVKMEYDFIE